MANIFSLHLGDRKEKIMDYCKKALQWKQKKLKGKGDDLELLCKDEFGNWMLISKFPSQYIDCFYFCMLDNGKRVVEISWKEEDERLKTQVGIIVIKDTKKLIFVNADDKGYGFGYNETEKNQGFVLYMRIKTAARLMWADSGSDVVKCAMEVSNNSDKAAELDYLLEFIKGNDDNQKSNITDTRGDEK